MALNGLFCVDVLLRNYSLTPNVKMETERRTDEHRKTKK